ncbi:MAG: hypothetical protein IT370_32640 [Deltaproteobacteria bacterium]|nr:hypothetical protein [Deltaproteobacteria bacterium]
MLARFEAACPDDERPRRAIAAGRTWLRTGVFSMAVIRAAALDAHAAARAVAHDDVARSAARAAGQAVATAHARGHAVAAALYAATVVRDAALLAGGREVEAAVLRERRWQLRRLRTLVG